MDKKSLFLAALAIVMLCCVSCGERTTELFNGKNLDGWSFIVDPANPAPAAEVYGVKDGVITISGQPFGFMYTDATYGDCVLHVEWRWIGEPTNSGLFMHLEPSEMLWPRCAEVNLQAGRAGDMIASGGSAFEELKETGGRFKPSPNTEKVEKPAGEWNVAEVVCRDNFIQAYINGVLKNEAHFDRSSGHIGIQSEGGPLEIRNIYVKPLKD